MSRTILISVILGATISACCGTPWLPVLLWGSIATCVAAGAEAVSLAPLLIAIAPSVLLLHPQVFDGLSPELRTALTAALSFLAAWSAIEMQDGEDLGLGRTTLPRDGIVGESSVPKAGGSEGVRSAGTPPGGQG